MSKLSPYQSELLRFFAAGGVVEFCTSVGSQLGAISFPAERPPRFNKLVLYALLKTGLVKAAQEKVFYGLRWSQVTISGKGRDLVVSWEEANEKV